MPRSQPAEGRAGLKIAYLGWGSLVWDKRDLPIAGDWAKGGPVLPIEFSRISNDGRLTLVIDEKHGGPVHVRYSRSASESLEDAVNRLWRREGKPRRERIGFLNLSDDREDPSSRNHHPPASDLIKVWAESNGWEAIVWTALTNNFEEKSGEAYSAEAALKYLRDLPAEKRAPAIEYINKAPEEVDTPFRRLFAQARLA